MNPASQSPVCLKGVGGWGDVPLAQQVGVGVEGGDIVVLCSAEVHGGFCPSRSAHRPQNLLPFLVLP